jgi:LysM repeat protein
MRSALTQREEYPRPHEGALPDGLPSRKVRHARKRMRVTAMLVPGLAVFGAIFFGLVALELYKAQSVSKAVVASMSAPAPNKASQPLTPATPGTLASPPPSEGGRASSPVPTRVNISGQVKAQETAAKPVTKAAPAKSTDNRFTSKTPAPKAKRHLVKKGDTLFKLSRQYYGNQSGVKRIASYNGLRPDQELTAGTVIMIPVRP